MRWFSDVLFALNKIADMLGQLIAAVKFSAYRPKLVRWKVIKEGENMLIGKFVLPAPGAADVVKRVLTVAVNGGEPVEDSYAGDALESNEYSFEDGAEVTGSLVDIDDAGNASQPSEFSVTVTDTIAPPQPGVVGFSVAREE